MKSLSEVVEVLVEAGANVNQATLTMKSLSEAVKQTGMANVSPLLIAAQQGYIDILRVLVKAGADLDQARDNGATPVNLAAAVRCQPTVNM